MRVGRLSYTNIRDVKPWKASSRIEERKVFAIKEDGTVLAQAGTVHIPGRGKEPENAHRLLRRLPKEKEPAFIATVTVCAGHTEIVLWKKPRDEDFLTLAKSMRTSEEYWAGQAKERLS